MAKAVTLGRQVDPSNPMFGGAGGAAAVRQRAQRRGAAAAAMKTATSGGTAPGRRRSTPTMLDSLRQDVSHLANRAHDQSANRKDRCGGTGVEESANRAASGGRQGHNGRAAGLAAKGLGKAEPAKAPPAFDFEMDEVEKPTMPHRTSAPAERSEEDSVSRSLSRPQAAVDLDKLELSFDPDHATFEDPTPSVLSGQWHDAATKLDLAMAYQEMGDVEGAREILQEVLHEGDEQRNRSSGAADEARLARRLTGDNGRVAGGGRKPAARCLSQLAPPCESLSDSSIAALPTRDGSRSATDAACRTRSERALAEIAETKVGTIAAGRTDTGVHATMQVVHFDTGAVRPDTAWVRGVNANLPSDIAVLWAQDVADDFHARRAAVARHYVYVLLNRPVRPALLAGRTGWYHRPLYVAAMIESARILAGTHDFSAFRAAGVSRNHRRKRCSRSGLPRAMDSSGSN
jgi:FimV-like protein